MAGVPSRIERGREAFAGQRWGDAYELLEASGPLEAEDLERLAIAAHLVGRDRESTDAWEQAHHSRLRAEDPDRAARCAFWLGMGLMLLGDTARAGGWLARAERLLDDLGGDSPVGALLLVPEFLAALDAGDGATASDLAGRMMEAARRLDDPDLRGMAILSGGQAALVSGDVSRRARHAAEAPMLRP